MTKFREKTREIEAVQLKIIHERPLMGSHIVLWEHDFEIKEDKMGFYIENQIGRAIQKIYNGDWITKDDSGLFAIKQDIFEKTYEAIKE